LLNILRRIVQEVNEAQDLKEVLEIIVNRVAETIQTEACSVYLTDTRKNHYKLAASVGFNENAEVTLKFTEGIIGLVGEREEPINLDDATTHERYCYFPQTGEERYKAFLGVPIIHQRKLVGIIVVQHSEQRRFDDGEEAFLVTISAQLAGIIAHAQTAGMIIDMYQREADPLPSVLRGISGAPGIAIGQGIVTYAPADLDKVPDRKITDVSSELKRFKKAIKSTREDIQRLQSRLISILPPEEQTLFDAYLGILESQTISLEITALIQAGHWAPFAIRKVFKGHVRHFENMEDPYLRERGMDLLDLGRRLLGHLQSESEQHILFPKNTILIGDEVTASSLAEVPEGHLVGVISAKGSSNSHVAILARAMGIPTVIGITGLPVAQLDGRELIVDGYNGEVYSSPTPAMRTEFARLAEEEKELYAGLAELRFLRAETPDEVRFSLCVNTGLVADIRPSLKAGAEGVGLYRTEVPFMIRDRFPGEEEQFLIYRQLLEAFAPKPVTIRTLDIGGDKILPYFPIAEDNPFLGWRGIRVTLDHPEIFLVQLRAMLRANHGYNNLRILLPMISSVVEVDESMRLIRQAYREVISEGISCPFPAVGVMIEVPAAVYQIDELASRVDFLSVGSNDLTQYLLAVDRNNHQVANIYDALHPAVIRALYQIMHSADKHKIPVSVCGEMAGDPVAVIVLMGLGFNMLSMSAHSLPRVKWIIRNFTASKARILLKEVIVMEHPRDIRLHLEAALEQAGLGGLVRAGK
jgi:phosphotransferase system, enzyme I, PtsP